MGEGQLVAGRYRLLRRVGDGGMGVVWQAADLRLDRTVAIKLLRLVPDLTDDEAEQARQRVFREARIAARLQHQHAVAVYDVADDGAGQPLLVLEYLPSRSLAAVLAEQGVLPPERVARIGAQLAAALAAAHRAGIVHRDVKPGNVLLSEDGTAKITDFGLSHATGDVTVTQTGMLAGTPAFLSPESARGEPPGPASDVFSLGATLYAAVEGVPPFGELDNPIAQLHRVAAGHVPPPRRAGPLTEPLARMLADDPAGRPVMAQVAELMAAVAAGRVPGVRTPGPPPTRLDLHPSSGPSTSAGQHVPVAPVRSSRRTTAMLLGMLAAGLLALLGATLLTDADRPGTSGAGAAASPGSTGAPPAPRPVDPALVRQTVTGYYSALADDPQRAWPLLGPDLQTQDRERYDQFWRGVKDLRVVGTPEVSENTATVRIEYTVESRGRISETHQLGMLPAGDHLLINSDQVIAAQITAGEDGGEDKKDKDDDKDDEDNKNDAEDGRGRGRGN